LTPFLQSQSKCKDALRASVPSNKWTCNGYQKNSS